MHAVKSVMFSHGPFDNCEIPIAGQKRMPSDRIELFNFLKSLRICEGQKYTIKSVAFILASTVVTVNMNFFYII